MFALTTSIGAESASLQSVASITPRRHQPRRQSDGAKAPKAA
jgi:hypothetical protein